MKYALVILILLSTSCGSNQTPTKKADTTAAQKSTGIQYTCPMHPKYMSGKPGTCPKCGMELVEKDNSK